MTGYVSIRNVGSWASRTLRFMVDGRYARISAAVVATASSISTATGWASAAVTNDAKTHSHKPLHGTLHIHVAGKQASILNMLLFRLEDNQRILRSLESRFAQLYNF